MATYAYRDLGWRRVALVMDDWVVGWDAETAFVREFCALGGRVVGRVARSTPVSPAAVLARIPRGADGVAVLGSALSVTPTSSARSRGAGPARSCSVPTSSATRTSCAASRASTGSWRVLRPGGAGLPRRVGVPARLRHGLSGRVPRRAARRVVMSYRNAVEGVLDAFARVDGDLANGRRRLRVELGRLRTRLLGVPCGWTDAARRWSRRASCASARSDLRQPELTEVRAIHGVDQSIGGLVPASYVPSSAGQACRRATPPPWGG